MRVSLLLFFLCLTTFLFAQPDFYGGTIKEKIPVKMKLSWDVKTQQFSGSYFYVSVGEEIKLESRAITNRKDSLTIYEYVGTDQEPNAKFKGLFMSNGDFRGWWSDNFGQKFPFQFTLENSVKIKYVSKNGFTYPQVSGMANAQVMEKVNRILKEYKKGTVRIEAEEDNGSYRDVLDFDIVFNGRHVLTLYQEQLHYSEDPEYLMGSTGKYVCINLKSGLLLKFTEVLSETSKKNLSGKLIKENEGCKDFLDKLGIEEILNKVALTQKGILFPVPNCGAPGRFDNDVPFIIPYSKINGYIAPNGLLK